MSLYCVSQARCWLTQCVCVMFASSGQHRSWRRPSPAVEANPLVLSWHVQGSDRPNAGAHAQPCSTSGGQEGGARVRPRAQLLWDPQRKPQSQPRGEANKHITRYVDRNGFLFLHADQRLCDILLWLFADSFQISVKTCMHTSSIGRKTMTFHWAGFATALLWHAVNNPQKHLHETVSIAAVPSSR